MANNPRAPRQPKVRNLKVYDKILFRYRGRFAADKAYSVTFPEIRLMGRWLLNCGFEPGQHIQVTTGRNKLTITPAWFDDED